MGIDQPKTIRTIRLLLTCLILFLLTWYYQLPEREWSLITVWFVMAEYSGVGGVFKKSVYRFSGTLLSALYGMIIIYFFANNVVINMLALVAGVFFYMYYFLDGDKTYIAVIGSVTLTIVLLNHNNLDAAILRTFNVIIGILGSMFMIRFFYPTYARDEIIEAHANVIEQLSEIIESYLDTSKSLAIIKADYLKHERIIITTLASYGRHLSEAGIETLKTPYFIIHNKSAIENIRHLFRILSVLINYLTTEVTRRNPEINDKLRRLLVDLRTIGSSLEAHGAPPILCEPQSIKNITHDTTIANNTQNITFVLINVVLTNMSQEITALNEEIQKTIAIYAAY